MRNSFIGSLLVGAAVLGFSALAQPGAAQTRPDLSGVWDRPGVDREVPRGAGAAELPDRRNRRLPRQAFAMEEPPMRPEAAEKYRVARRGIPDIYQSGRDDIDPTYNCFPPGVPRIYTTPRPFEIHQLPQVVLMLFETDHWVRRIHTDGREHPDGYPKTWMGHSIGKWDGDTLVVDTVGMDERSWLDSLGHPMSDALRVVERFRRANRDTLEIDFQFDDPKTYTRTWTGKKVFQLMPANWQVMEDVVCDDLLEIGKKR